MTKNWPRYIYQVVSAINNSSNSAIGGLRPADIKSREDGPVIDYQIGLKMDTPVAIQKKNQAFYEKGLGHKTRIQVGDYVYLDFVPKAMDKSFDTKRNEIYKVIRVDAGKKPELYKLATLRQVPLKSYYYGKQLLKTTKPKPGEYFAIEKIVGEKIVRGKEYVRVKYLHYGNEFNKWLPKANILKGAK